MNSQAKPAAIVSYEPWKGSTFAGVRVTLTGTPEQAGKDDSFFPDEIPSGWIADTARDPNGVVMLLVVCRDGIDPVANRQDITDQLIATVARRPLKLSLMGAVGSVAGALAFWPVFALAFAAIPS